jgi:hypothetical protein
MSQYTKYVIRKTVRNYWQRLAPLWRILGLTLLVASWIHQGLGDESPEHCMAEADGYYVQELNCH